MSDFLFICSVRTCYDNFFLKQGSQIFFVDDMLDAGWKVVLPKVSRPVRFRNKNNRHLGAWNGIGQREDGS